MGNEPTNVGSAYCSSDGRNNINSLEMPASSHVRWRWAINSESYVE
jgi:hypothetical protein